MYSKALRLLLISVFFVQAVAAQNLTKSPYSSIGIGDLAYSANATQVAMGRLSQGLSKPFELNYQNPASYGSLMQTCYEAGGIMSMGKLSSNAGSSDFNNGSFGYLSLGFPVSKKLKWGAAFGLLPFSSVGYNVSSPVVTPDFTATQDVSGRGGLSRFYVGTGIRVFKGLSVGVNGSYLYGQVKNSLLLNIPAQYNRFNIVEDRDRYLGDLYFEYGAQYKIDSIAIFSKSKNRNNYYNLTLGATVTPASKISATDDYTVRSLGVGRIQGTPKDTIVHDGNREGTIQFPLIFKAGFTLEKPDRWTIGMDVMYSGWSNYEAFGYKDSLKNNVVLRGGLSFIPKYDNYKNYFSRIEYRLGGFVDNGNIVAKGTDIISYGVSAGMGLPLGRNKSRINLAAEYFVRGSQKNGLIKEEYFRFTIGFTICDTWFQRYKYD